MNKDAPRSLFGSERVKKAQEEEKQAAATWDATTFVLYQVNVIGAKGFRPTEVLLDNQANISIMKPELLSAFEEAESDKGAVNPQPMDVIERESEQGVAAENTISEWVGEAGGEVAEDSGDHGDDMPDLVDQEGDDSDDKDDDEPDDDESVDGHQNSTKKDDNEMDDEGENKVVIPRHSTRLQRGIKKP